jgi:uncharacterized damage-inducible protein DinB
MNYYSGADLARSFRTVRKNTLQIANEIPENQYGFRASKDTRTIGELLAHIAASVGWTYRVHAVDKASTMSFEDFTRYGQENTAYEKSLKTKADIIKALEVNGQQFSAWMESVSDATLAETVTFPASVVPPKKTRFEMILSAREHEMHHRAQLMLIERLIGIVPHLTREREARLAATRS